MNMENNGKSHLFMISGEMQSIETFRNGTVLIPHDINGKIYPQHAYMVGSPLPCCSSFKELNEIVEKEVKSPVHWKHRIN
jgi:hypothetical protein